MLLALATALVLLLLHGKHRRCFGQQFSCAGGCLCWVNNGTYLARALRAAAVAMSTTAAVSFLNRMTTFSAGTQVVLFAYKKHTSRRKEAVAARASPSAGRNDSADVSPRPRDDPALVSWPTQLGKVAKDSAVLWVAGAVACALNQALQRLVAGSKLRSASAMTVALQFAFGTAVSALVQRVDPQRWRQGMLAGLSINSAFEAAYQLICRGGGGGADAAVSAAAAMAGRERVGTWVVKAIMAVVGAQLSHAFILTPFSMSPTDLRFFRLASGHSLERHERVVKATGGALRYADLAAAHGGDREGGALVPHSERPSNDHEHQHHTHRHRVDDNDDDTKTTAEEKQRDADSDRADADGDAISADDTFCRLVHPGKDCMNALTPSFLRAFKMALLLYAPFLSLQIVRRLLVSE